MTDKQNTIESLIKDLLEGMAIKRWKALEKLGKMQAEEAVPSIITVMKNAKISDVRRKAAETLGKIGSKNAVRSLLETSLNKEEAGEVRRAAIKATGELALIESVPALINIKKNGPMIDRVIATQALRNMATKLGYKNINALENAFREKLEQKKLATSDESKSKTEEEFYCSYCNVKIPDNKLITCPYCNAPLTKK